MMIETLEKWLSVVIMMNVWSRRNDGPRLDISVNMNLESCSIPAAGPVSTHQFMSSPSPPSMLSYLITTRYCNRGNYQRRLGTRKSRLDNLILLLI